MSVAAIGAIAVVLVAVIGFAGTYYVQRQIKHAAERQERIDAQKVDAQAYVRARELDERVAKQLHDEITRLHDTVDYHRSQCDELRKHVERLEMRDRKRDELAHRHTGWDYTVLDIIRQLDEGRKVQPPPPLFLD